MPDFKKAEVSLEQFMGITDATELVTFTINKVAIQQDSDLFGPPAIPTVPYAQMLLYAGEVTSSNTVFDNAPTHANWILREEKMDYLKSQWVLNSEWIEGISNDPANASSTATAAANISQAGLEFHSLTDTESGIPEQPVVKVVHDASGQVKVMTTNSEYDAAMTTYIVVETASNATVTVVEGQATFVFTNNNLPPGFNAIVKTVMGKGGIFTLIKNLTPGRNYTIAAFGTNSKGKSGAVSVLQSFFAI